MDKISKGILQPSAAIIIIGDEILSGRTQDTNTQFLAKKLTDVGINLCEVRVVADIKAEIVSTVEALSTKYDYVFTSGGIGPTHDDITADSIAEAFKVSISVRDDARKLIAENYINGEASLNEARLKMARIPDGAILIDNPISKAPGFQLSNVYVMAGIPTIFKAMVESIVPNLVGGKPLLSISVKFFKAEGEIAEALGLIAGRFKEVSIGSYPFRENNINGTNVVVRHHDQDILNSLEIELKNLI